MPPLGPAYLDVSLQEAELQQPIYYEIVDALLPHVDLFLCETMASGDQTWAAASAASASGKPFWVRCIQVSLGCCWRFLPSMPVPSLFAPCRAH